MIGKIPYLEGNSEEDRGTEYMAHNVTQKFFSKLSNLHEYNWVLIPNKDHKPSEHDSAKNNKTIIWLHVPVEDLPEEYSFYFKNKAVKENTVAYIVQSEFHKKNLTDYFRINPSKVHILNNAFEPIELVPKSADKHVKFIFTPQAKRGLYILLDAMGKVKDKNFSLIVHGVGKCECGNSSCSMNTFYRRCLEDPRVFPVGWTDKSTYIKNLQEAHVMVYPSLFAETAGIAIMEAMSAGVKIYCSDLGALSETTLGFASIIPGFSDDTYEQALNRKKYVRSTAKAIKAALREIRKKRFDPMEQSLMVNQRFSFEAIEEQWKKFDKSLATKK